ncbi:MAG: transcriptional regulator [Lentilactobacillus diolivorans]|nr:transcriptional regulator [Lentilactobacillus diolivorans]RRG01968.1 MAG: transcriptional regulator [Lactobacillus sp.]
MDGKTTLLSALSCRRYLTLIELAKLTHQDKTKCRQNLLVLRSHGTISCRHFAGRDYFISRKKSKRTTLGQQADTYLEGRSAAIEIGDARTCYHHLAGKVGTQLFKNCLDKGWLTTDEGDYIMTIQGREAFQKLLRWPIKQIKVKTCIDFSERLPHLAGKLGTDVLKRLIAEGDVRLGKYRHVLIKKPLEDWL